MAISFCLRPVSCSLDPAGNGCGNLDWGLCGWSRRFAMRALCQKFADLFPYRRMKSNARSKAHPGRECRSVSPLHSSFRSVLPTHRSPRSHPYRPTSNDVAYPHQSAIRVSPCGVLNPQDLAVTRPLHHPHSPFRDAWARMGDPAREEVGRREAGCGACRHRTMYW